MDKGGYHITKQGMVIPPKIHSGHIGYNFSFPLFFAKTTIRWITNYFGIQSKSGLNIILLFDTSNNDNTKYRRSIKYSESKHSIVTIIVGEFVLRNSPDLKHIFLMLLPTSSTTKHISGCARWYVVFRCWSLRLNVWSKHQATPVSTIHS